MKGLYINIPDSGPVYDALHVMNIPHRAVEFPSDIKNKGLLVYDPGEWKREPFYHDRGEGLFMAVYGWFIYENEKNNLERFAVDFQREKTGALERMDGGVFLIYVEHNGYAYLINDLLSLSHHFYDQSRKTLTVAPSPFFFDQKEENGFLGDILYRQGHLFGNYTLYENIRRLEPGSVCCDDPSEWKRYFSPDQHIGPDQRAFDGRKLIKDIGHLSAFWNEEDLVIPLSGGLDSRLILACTASKVGYCYGPPKSKDRKIADKFKHHLHTLHGFSLLDVGAGKREKEKARELFRGVEKEPLVGLLFAFRHVRERFPDHYADLDGFAGDVFQKGMYITFPGLSGGLYRLFPSLFYKNFNEKKLVRVLEKRYGNLNREQLNFLLRDFHQRTRHLEMDPLKRLTWYELFHGRGTRHIISGGIVMKSQYLTVVPPFCYKPVLENLFSLDLYHSLTHQNMQTIWSHVDRKMASLGTEYSFHPLMPRFMGRFLKMASKVLERSMLPVKSFQKELKQIDDPQ